MAQRLGNRRFPQEVTAEKIQAEQQTKAQIEAEIGDHKMDIPTLPPSLNIFREEISQALDNPGTKKVAFHGLIRQVTVHPDATLEIECAIKLTQKQIALQHYQSCANLKEPRKHWISGFRMLLDDDHFVHIYCV